MKKKGSDIPWDLKLNEARAGFRNLPMQLKKLGHYKLVDQHFTIEVQS